MWHRDGPQPCRAIAVAASAAPEGAAGPSDAAGGGSFGGQPQPLGINDYRQMSGRAGRAGLAKEGQSVLVARTAAERRQAEALLALLTAAQASAPAASDGGASGKRPADSVLEARLPPKTPRPATGNAPRTQEATSSLKTGRAGRRTRPARCRRAPSLVRGKRASCGARRSRRGA